MSAARDTVRLHDRYARELYLYCLARLRSPEEAEDAVQNTFVRVFRALDAGARPEFESAWLYRIAANVCLSRSALARRRAPWHAETELERLPVAAPEVDPEARRALIDAVSSLPKNQRDAILLREWQGLTYAEIAASLDTSVPAVETLLVRARRQLVSLLRPRMRGGILDGLVLLRVRSWFGAATASHLAAGAAVIALGGVVAGADVGAADTHRSEQAAPVAPVAVAAPAETTPHRSVPVRRVPSVAPRRTPAAPAPVAAVHVLVREATPVAVAPSAPARPAPQAAAPPAAVTSPPAPAEPAPKQPATAAAEPAPALAYAAPAPAVSVPAVTTPAVTLPSASLPVPLPVPVPAVTVPAVTLPPVTVTTPAVPNPLPVLIQALP